MTDNNKWRRIAFGFLAFAALAASLAAIVVLIAKHPRKSVLLVPNVPRARLKAAFDKVFDPAPAIPPPAVFMKWARPEITSDTQKLHLTLDLPPWDDKKVEWPAALRSLRAGETLEENGRGIGLEAIGVSLPGKTDATNSGGVMPYAYYKPDGAVLGQDAFPQLSKRMSGFGTMRDSSGDLALPALRLVLRLTNWPDFKPLSVSVFDAATHAALSNGYGYSMASRKPGASSDIQLFPIDFDPLLSLHNGPVTIGIDMAPGEPKTASFPATPGEGFIDGDIACVMAALVDGMSESSGYSSNSAGGRLNMSFSKFVAGKSSAAAMMALFACYPKAGRSPLHFAFFDAAGNKIESVDKFASGRWAELRMPAGSVPVRVEASYTSQITRVTIQLDKIPGLPELPGSPGDLTMQKVPYAKFASREAMRQFLTGALRCDVSYTRNPPFGGDAFPEFHDATVGDVLTVFANGGAISYDPIAEVMKIDVPEPWLERIRRWALEYYQPLRKMLGKI